MRYLQYFYAQWKPGNYDKRNLQINQQNEKTGRSSTELRPFVFLLSQHALQ